MNKLDNPAAYRIELTGKIIQDVITGKSKPPELYTPEQYALYLIGNAFEDLGRVLNTEKQNS